MTPEILASLDAALAMLPENMDSAQARIQILAIGLQESRFLYRRQMNEGPAMGFLQFERNGGVKGVLNHKASKSLARAICKARGVAATPMAAWKALESDDVLAMAFGRLLLWTDPEPLPAIGDADDAWNYYLRNWRPGRPHRKTWNAFYAQAKAQVTGA